MNPFIILLCAGAVAYNGTLADVHNRRNKLFDQNLPVDGFVCRVGVQSRYADLIGQNVWFYSFDSQTVTGPHLVVDMAAPKHAGIMERDGIAIDSECDWMVHDAGILFATIDYHHNDTMRVTAGRGIVSRVRALMRGHHRICGRGVDCHWRVMDWVY